MSVVGAIRGLEWDADVVDVARMSGGRISRAYEVSFADGADPVVIKVYDEQQGWRLAKEVSIYRVMRERGVTAMPRILSAGKSDGALGRPYLVMSRLAGIAMGDISDMMPANEVAECYRQMGVLLAELHAIEQEAFGYLTTKIIDPQPTSARYMRSLFRNCLVYMKGTRGDEDLIRAANRYVADRGELFELCPRPVLIHNDFHEGNIIVDRSPDGPVVTGFIDVENAMAGDPMVDLAKTYNYSIRGDRVKLDGLFVGYGQVPEDFEARLRLFQLIHAFELWQYFHLAGVHEHLDGLIADVREIIAAG